MLNVIIPYRNREANLKKLVSHLHWFLPRNSINSYSIIVVEQDDDKVFNKGKLMNTGFKIRSEFEEKTLDHYVFHDVDLIPLEADYSFYENPIHLCPIVSQFDYKLPYENIFGGVTMFTKNAFTKVNGYSTRFYGWGAEDDDMFNRILAVGLTPHRRNYGAFLSLDHERIYDPVNVNLENVKIMGDAVKEYIATKEIKEGLSTTNMKINSIGEIFDCVHYKVTDI